MFWYGIDIGYYGLCPLRGFPNYRKVSQLSPSAILFTVHASRLTQHTFSPSKPKNSKSSFKLRKQLKAKEWNLESSLMELEWVLLKVGNAHPSESDTVPRRMLRQPLP